MDGLPCGTVTYYIKLTVAEDGRLIKEDNTRNSFYIFIDLSPNTHYNVSVYGNNNAGDGQAAAINVLTSPDHDNCRSM